MLFTIALLRTAWLCDDAYISFRASWNLVEGYGLRWNVAERVQTFTNPLWVLIVALAYRITGEFYYTVLTLSIGLSIATFLLIVSRGDVWTSIVVGSALILSKAFVDFSTSGLESPLTSLLLAAFTLAFLRERESLFFLGLFAALLAVNRLDTLVITSPALAWAFLRRRSSSALASVALGLSPLLAWILFAWLYYGFPLPNTAYAKALGIGIPRSQVLAQGLAYFRDSLGLDRVTLPAIASCVLGVLGSRRPRAFVLLVCIGAHLAYVVWVGGDFMSGRFLVAPLVVSAVLFVRLEPLRSPRMRWSAAVAVATFGFLSPTPTLLSGPDYEDEVLPPDFVTDERAFYFQKAGLLSSRRHAWKNLGNVPAGPRFEELRLSTWVGILSFEGGPGMHWIDDVGLCDPLIARLPGRSLRPFAPGHVVRDYPAGHLQSVWTGENRFAHAALSEYYRDLRLVTRGPLWDRERLRAVLRFALGRNRELMRRYVAEMPEPSNQRSVALGALDRVLPDGTPWFADEVLMFVRGVVVVKLGELAHAPRVAIGLDANDFYYLVAGNDLGALGETILVAPTTERQADGLRRREIELPPDVAEAGYTWIAVGGVGGDGLFVLGYLRLSSSGAEVDVGSTSEAK